MGNTIRIIGVSLAIVLLPAGPFATTFPVTKTDDTDDGTCDADCSLREAVEAANTNPGADDVPVPAGNYLLTLGQLVVSDDVSIAGAGQMNTIIDGNATDRVFKIQYGIVAEISGITMQNGSSGHAGGGISNEGDLTLTNSTVSDNTADFMSGGIAGGIVNRWQASLTLTNSTVSGNTAWDSGGIYNSGVLTLLNSTVSGNVARVTGGIDNDGDLTLTNSTVSGNTAYYSYGGINNRGAGRTNPRFGHLILTNSTVSDNTALFGFGGGIANGGVLTLTNTTVSGNTAGTSNYSYGGGGGIYNWWDGSLTLTNSTVSGNYAPTAGGILNAGDLALTNSTVSGNTAVYGNSGGIYNHAYASATPTNVIVADNSPGNCQGPLTSVGYNLTDDTSCGFTEPTDLVVADAMLGPLQDNGGPTETHALLPGSPAIDAGSACPPPDTDQRGIARPQGSACDIGAVEYLPEPGGTFSLIAVAGSLGFLYQRRRSAGARYAEGQEMVKRRRRSAR